MHVRLARYSSCVVSGYVILVVCRARVSPSVTPPYCGHCQPTTEVRHVATYWSPVSALPDDPVHSATRQSASSVNPNKFLNRKEDKRRKWNAKLYLEANWLVLLTYRMTHWRKRIRGVFATIRYTNWRPLPFTFIAAEERRLSSSRKRFESRKNRGVRVQLGIFSSVNSSTMSRKCFSLKPTI